MRAKLPGHNGRVATKLPGHHGRVVKSTEPKTLNKLASYPAMVAGEVK